MAVANPYVNEAETPTVVGVMELSTWLLVFVSVNETISLGFLYPSWSVKRSRQYAIAELGRFF